MAYRNRDAFAHAISGGDTGIVVARDAPIAPFTSLKVGGLARLLVRTRDAQVTIAVAEAALLHHVPMLIIGGGSNVVVADAGFDGLVIKVDAHPGSRVAGTIVSTNGDAVLVDVEAGCQTAGFARWAARQGLAGIEWACGIPGTVGGAVVGNAGAYGGDMAGVVDTVDAWLPSSTPSTSNEYSHLEGGSVTRFAVHEMAYRYRTSRLKHGNGVVLGARLRLRREDPASVLARIDTYDAARRQKQPTERSCGSVFRNPPGEIAGRLLEQAGMKGRCRGDAQVSTIHANWIINRGAASAADVVSLMREGQQAVLARSGVRLQLEVLLVGAWDPKDVGGLTRDSCDDAAGEGQGSPGTAGVPLAPGEGNRVGTSGAPGTAGVPPTPGGEQRVGTSGAPGTAGVPPAPGEGIRVGALGVHGVFPA